MKTKPFPALTFITLLLTTLAIYACAGRSNYSKSAQQQPGQYMIKGGKVVSLEDRPMTGCVMMKGGKMMLVENGNMTPMKKNLTMPDGTRCMLNGVCVMRDGQKVNLQEGEMLDYAHRLFRAKGLRLPGE